MSKQEIVEALETEVSHIREGMRRSERAKKAAKQERERLERERQSRAS